MTNEIGAHVFDLRVTGAVLLPREESCVTFWGATSELALARYASLITRSASLS